MTADNSKPPEEELIPHSVNELRRTERDIRIFMRQPGATSYGFPIIEALELVHEAMEYAKIMRES